MDLRETVSLPLPPSLRSRLLAAGFLTVADFHTLKPEDLARDASLSLEDARHVLGVAAGSIQTSIIPTAAGIAGARSAWELLEAERGRGRVQTMCAELDAMLGGGVALQELTEICGPPGVGKTQLGMQLAINVQTPAVLGGVEGEAVYIDTEGSFMVERAAEMADAWVAHCNAAAAAIDAPARDTTAPAAALVGVHYLRVYDHTEQSALVHSLPHLLALYPKVCAMLPLVCMGGIGSSSAGRGALPASAATCVHGGMGIITSTGRSAWVALAAAALAGVHYLRVYDHTEQTALVHSLPHLLALHPKVRSGWACMGGTGSSSAGRGVLLASVRSHGADCSRALTASPARSPPQGAWWFGWQSCGWRVMRISSSSMREWHWQQQLAGVHYLRVYDHTEQTALVHSLPHLLALHPKVKVVVIDCATFRFTHKGLRSPVFLSPVALPFPGFTCMGLLRLSLASHLTAPGQARGDRQRYLSFPPRLHRHGSALRSPAFYFPPSLPCPSTSTMPQVKLVVIDSVTFHFRHGFTDMGLRSRLLASMARELLAIADEHNVAVSPHLLCVCQMHGNGVCVCELH
ncbi:unnamed protein product [Closterium sp. Naga37s-1]|nr:unnamed protein product [Closterium sp. Naga37s-1]